MRKHLHHMEGRNLLSGIEVRQEDQPEIVEKEEVVRTRHGPVKVVVQGDNPKDTIITYHDVGLNYRTCFKPFVNHPKIQHMFAHFRVIHINAPGQEDEAEKTKYRDKYPNMEGLAEQVEDIVQYYGVKYMVGMGVGAGANVLMQHAVKYPKYVRGLILISPDELIPNWLEWSFLMSSLSALSWVGVTNYVTNYLLQRYFSIKTYNTNTDLCESTRRHIKGLKANNLHKYLKAHAYRKDLTKEIKDFKGRTMVFVGKGSLQEEGAIDINSGIGRPGDSSLLEIEDRSGLITTEDPEVLAEPLMLYFGGLGYYLRPAAVRNPEEEEKEQDEEDKSDEEGEE
mmetsp:Transcript_2432/g.2717  ORF Transcript_2432/g.2717 Transcript_2432/m.2717 type:complete len:339 (+) Transcript_2432:11-1027(+)